MRIAFCFILFTFGIKAAPIIEYHRASMINILIYEKMQHPVDKINIVMNAFKNCGDKELIASFYHATYNDFITNENAILSSNDSVVVKSLVDQCLYMDIDNDQIEEILFHTNFNSFPIAVIFKRQSDNSYKLIFKEYAFFTNLVFAGKPVKSFEICNLHNDSNPFDLFRVYDQIIENDKSNIILAYKLNIPYNYHYPAKTLRTEKPAQFKVSELFFYYKELYNKFDYPYNVSMGQEFDTQINFNYTQTNWPKLTKSNIRYAIYIENRGGFSTVLVCENASFATDIPEYILLYIPNYLIVDELVK